MSENKSNYLTKADLVEWAEKVFLPAFDKIFDVALNKYLGSSNHCSGEVKVIDKK